MRRTETDFELKELQALHQILSCRSGLICIYSKPQKHMILIETSCFSK